MTDYNNGKIYRLDSSKGTYVGSTVATLSKRLTDHKCSYKSYQRGTIRFITCHVILEDPTCTITLVEAYPCATKKDLLIREKYWIGQIECVNKCNPIREEGDKAAWHAEHYQKIKLTDKHLATQAKCVENAKAALTPEKKDKLNAKITARRHEDPEFAERRREQVRAYQQQNRDALNQRKREKRAADKLAGDVIVLA